MRLPRSFQSIAAAVLIFVREGGPRRRISILESKVRLRRQDLFSYLHLLNVSALKEVFFCQNPVSLSQIGLDADLRRGLQYHSICGAAVDQACTKLIKIDNYCTLVVVARYFTPDMCVVGVHCAMDALFSWP
jgi:hypothetical protein